MIKVGDFVYIEKDDLYGIVEHIKYDMYIIFTVKEPTHQKKYYLKDLKKVF